MPLQNLGVNPNSPLASADIICLKLSLANKEWLGGKSIPITKKNIYNKYLKISLTGELKVVKESSSLVVKAC